MAKTAKSSNDNIASFVDGITPTPKIIKEDYLDMDVLATYLKKATPEQMQWVQQMIDTVLAINKQPEFISLGEKYAINSLKKLNILV